jgi:hypothetical protein
MACDCGYSFVDGTPPRYGQERPENPGDDLASRTMTRIVIRVVGIVISLLLVLAIRACGH